MRRTIRVVASPAALDCIVMGDGPVGERRDRGDERAAKRAQRVLDPGRDDREDRALDQPVALELAQGEGEDSLRDTDGSGLGEE